MSGDREGLSGEIARVLGEHRQGALTCYDHPPTVDEPWWCCECGEHLIKTSHRAHLADALADLLAGWERGVRAEALREAAEDVETALLAEMVPERVLQADVVHYLRRRADSIARGDAQ